MGCTHWYAKPPWPTRAPTACLGRWTGDSHTLGEVRNKCQEINAFSHVGQFLSWVGRTWYRAKEEVTSEGSCRSEAGHRLGSGEKGSAVIAVEVL